MQRGNAPAHAVLVLICRLLTNTNTKFIVVLDDTSARDDAVSKVGLNHENVGVLKPDHGTI